MRPCGVCRQPCPDGDCPKHPRKGGYRPERRSVRGGVYGKAWQRLRDYAVRLARGRCAYCRAAGATGDHVIPTSKGGRSVIGNVVCACATCNTSKGDRTLREWIASGTAPANAQLLLIERESAGLPV